MDENYLVHYGVLGMRWGTRKAKLPSSSDHNTFATIRKKKLRDMSDDEIKTITTRMRLVVNYKKIKRETEPFHFLRPGKPIHAMSNEDLKAASRRYELIREDRKHGVRKPKKIKEMSDEEVKKVLNRHYLEKTYKGLGRDDVESASKLLRFYLATGAAIYKIVKSK